MERRKVLVLGTVLMGAAVLGGLGWGRMRQLPEPVALQRVGLPAVGKGHLEIVVFEDFRCGNCQRFQERVVPKIWEEYVAPGRARYTFVPVAFLAGSKQLANAALAVYQVAPERFFAFAEALFREEDGDLIALAKKVGGIDLAYFQEAVQQQLFYGELEQILEWARGIMGKKFGVPALYVNGVMTPTGSFRAVQRRIERVQQ